MMMWRAAVCCAGACPEVRDAGLEHGRDHRAGDRGGLGPVSRAGRVGLGSLIEIGASAVVIWELPGTGEDRQRRGLRLIGYAFAALALYLLVQSSLVLAARLPSRALGAGDHLDRGDRGGDDRAGRWQGRGRAGGG